MAQGSKETFANMVKSLLRRLFVDNIGLKLFSFLIALLLWLFVLGAEDVTTTVDVPLFFRLSADRVLVSDVPHHIKINVSGPWATLKSWNTENIEVSMDLSKTDLGPSVVYFEESLFRLPPGLKLVRVNPSQLTISLAKKASKIVRLLPMHSGKPAAGYVVKAIEPIPEVLTIEGAESDLLIIDEVLTEEINVTGKRETFTTTTTPVRLSKNIQFPSKDPILVTVTIKKDLIERTLLDIPISVKNTNFQTSLKPPTTSITVSGPREAVEKLTRKEITAFIDVGKEEGDIPGTTSTREVEFGPLPDNIKIKAGSYTVKLIISSVLKNKSDN